MLLPNKRSNKRNLYVNENLRGVQFIFFFGLFYFIEASNASRSIYNYT